MESGFTDLEILCPHCGTFPAGLTLPDNYTDNSIALCNECGAELGHFGDIRRAAMKAAMDRATNVLKGQFKTIKGFKIK